MYKKISSTELKQNTKKVLNQVVKEPQEAVIVYNYNEPKAVIISYEVWKMQQKIQNKKPTLEELSKYFISTKEKVDSAKIIREMRDED